MAVPFLLAILLSVTLAPPFGEAEARALTLTGGITIDVSVEVEGAPTTVIARISGLAGELDPQALVDRGGGTWGTIIKLTGREDVLVAFEYIDTDGATFISDASTLTALGVDPAAIAPNLPTKPPPEEPGVDPWLLAGVAAALGALVLFGFWAGSGLKESVRPTGWTYASTQSGKELDDDDENTASGSGDGGPADDVDEEPSSEAGDAESADDSEEDSE
ncbi:MAG: hypothetical protein BMS9Abin07_2197 [Acidimicrobiia bacterium]|nr:MAG: hypothetical protein BMS9Abin07_2197 [Acidimicrobiia bacterium]